MNADEIAMFGLILFLAMCILFMSTINPIRESNAQTECEMRGFETFVTYNNVFFQISPVGLVCGTMQSRMIKEGRIGAYVSNNDLIIQEVK